MSLKVRDKELMAGYDASWIDTIYPFAWLVNIWNFILIVARFVTDGQKITHWFYLYGSMSVSFFMITIAIKLKRKLFDYLHAWIIFVRIAATFSLMYLVSTGTEGFEHIDLKELCQTIDFVALPYIVLTFVNWKFNLIVTVPVTMVSCYIATIMSLTPDDGNMACFKEHETFSRNMA